MEADAVWNAGTFGYEPAGRTSWPWIIVTHFRIT